MLPLPLTWPPPRAATPPRGGPERWPAQLPDSPKGAPAPTRRPDRMDTFWACQFEIDPPAGRASGECFAAVRDEVARWVLALAVPPGRPFPRLAFDGSVEAPAPGHAVRARERAGGDYRLATLEWEFAG